MIRRIAPYQYVIIIIIIIIMITYKSMQQKCTR